MSTSTRVRVGGDLFGDLGGRAVVDELAPAPSRVGRSSGARGAPPPRAPSEGRRRRRRRRARRWSRRACRWRPVPRGARAYCDIAALPAVPNRKPSPIRTAARPPSAGCSDPDRRARLLDGAGPSTPCSRSDSRARSHTSRMRATCRSKRSDRPGSRRRGSRSRPRGRPARRRARAGRRRAGRSRPLASRPAPRSSPAAGGSSSRADAFGHAGDPGERRQRLPRVVVRLVDRAEHVKAGLVGEPRPVQHEPAIDIVAQRVRQSVPSFMRRLPRSCARWSPPCGAERSGFRRCPSPCARLRRRAMEQRRRRADHRCRCLDWTSS